jgi:PPOX class probable F420-dependent enzyme
MLDFSTRFGRHVNRRLRQEKIIWLTTVDSNNTPQPRPVWFHWDGETVLIFSERQKAKLRHIAANPRVALNFNTDEDGGDVVVLIGDARILDEPPDPNRVKTYLRKYREGIKDLGMTVQEFSDSYSVPILVTPKSMRGFVE